MQDVGVVVTLNLSPNLNLPFIREKQ